MADFLHIYSVLRVLYLLVIVPSLGGLKTLFSFTPAFPGGCVEMRGESILSRIVLVPFSYRRKVGGD